MIYFRLLLTSIFILIAPGLLLYFIVIDKNRNWAEILPISFSLSVLFFTIPGLIAYLLHPTHTVFSKVFFGLVILVLALFIIVAHKRKELLSIKKDSIEEKSPAQIIILPVVLIGIFFSILMIIYEGCITTDGIGFLAYIKKLAVNPIICNQDGFYKEILVDTTYGYNVWFLLVAFISKIAKCDPIQTWIFLPIMLTPLIILSFYTLAKTLFKSQTAAFASVFIFLVFFGINEGCWIFRTSPQPMIVTNFLIFPIALASAFKYFYEGKKIFLILAGLLGLVLSTIHLWGFAVFLMSIMFFLLVQLPFKGGKTTTKRILCVILLSILFSLPYIFLRLPYKAITNYAYLWVNEYKTLGKYLYYIRPYRLFASLYHVEPPFTPRGVLIFSFILSFFLFKWVKKDIWARFLIANMFIPPLIISNPFLVPVIHKILNFELIKRIAQVMPFMLVLGLFLDRSATSFGRFLQRMWKASFNKEIKLKPFYVIILLIIIGVLAPIPKFNQKLIHFVRGTETKGLSEWTANFVENPYAPKFLLTHYDFMPSLKFIRNNIKTTSVFLSDEEYGTFIGAYSKHYPVVALSHITSASANQKTREKDAAKMLNFDGTLEELMQILQKYNVNYIVLTPKCGLSKIEKFRQYSNIFKEIYEQNRIVIFKYLGREL